MPVCSGNLQNFAVLVKRKERERERNNSLYLSPVYFSSLLSLFQFLSFFVLVAAVE